MNIIYKKKTPLPLVDTILCIFFFPVTVECAAGEMYDEAADRCNPCEIGFYQPDVGQFFCYPCGALQTTPGVGSISEDSCESEWKMSVMLNCCNVLQLFIDNY